MPRQTSGLRTALTDSARPHSPFMFSPCFPLFQSPRVSESAIICPLTGRLTGLVHRGRGRVRAIADGRRCPVSHTFQRPGLRGAWFAKHANTPSSGSAAINPDNATVIPLPDDQGQARPGVPAPGCADLCVSGRRARSLRHRDSREDEPDCLRSERLSRSRQICCLGVTAWWWTFGQCRPIDVISVSARKTAAGEAAGATISGRVGV